MTGAKRAGGRPARTSGAPGINPDGRPERRNVHAGACDVLILYSHELFASGLERLLGARGHRLLVVDAGSKDTLKQVRVARPRMILVEDDDDDVFASKLRGIFKLSTDIKLIRISSQNNRLAIYSSTEVVAAEPGDLLDAIAALVENGEHALAGQPQVQESPPGTREYKEREDSQWRG